MAIYLPKGNTSAQINCQIVLWKYSSADKTQKTVILNRFIQRQ